MKKFFKKIGKLIAKPYKWMITNLKDWRTFVIFIIVYVILSCEVWVPYLIALIIGIKTPAGIALTSFATACFLFWQAPGTPFLLVCTGVTAGVKEILNRIKNKKSK